MPPVLSRRALIGGCSALALATRPSKAIGDNLAEDVAEISMFGFSGSTAASASAQQLSRHVAGGRVKNIVFVLGNVGPLHELKEVVALFQRGAPFKARLAIDHEGGAVQRLGPQHGCTALPRPLDVARTKTVQEALQLYAKAGREFTTLGFDINLAPVVDLYQRANPGIGEYGRAFSDDPAEVTKFGRAFVEGFEASGAICTLKHFPGHGRAVTDSHEKLPDITKSWTPRELEPFASMITSGHARIIMGGHLRLGSVETRDIPTTLSRAVTSGLVRERLGFDGVIMTDDIDMIAIARTMSRKEAFIRSLSAGNDIVMIRNEAHYDPDLPSVVVEWVAKAIAEGTLSRGDIAVSADRVRRLKRSLRPN
jgi:beta-N-acetylhexosaminidase